MIIVLVFFCLLFYVSIIIRVYKLFGLCVRKSIWLSATNKQKQASKPATKRIQLNVSSICWRQLTRYRYSQNSFTSLKCITNPSLHNTLHRIQARCNLED